MDRGKTKAGAHRWLDVAAAAVPAAAAGWAALRLAPLTGYPAAPLAAALALGLFAAAFAVMRRTDPPAAFALPAFAAPAAESELLLEQLWACADTFADELVLDTPVADEAGADELVLDDPLALPADARVVRLFDPRRFPDPGELNERIARHLARGGPAAAPSADASDELRQALAELRSALRPSTR